MFKKIVTHNGIFHADDIMALAIIKLRYNLTGASIERCVPTPEMLNDKDILVLDCGGQFNPELNNFDHHQRGFAMERDGVPYATAGLIWKEFCQDDKFINKDVWQIIENELIKDIDSRDVGKPLSQCSTCVSRLIHDFNKTSDSVDKSNDGFYKAIDFAYDVLSNMIKHANDAVQAKEYVMNAEIHNGILILRKYVPWLDSIHSHPKFSELKFVIFPSMRGGWNVQQIPIEKGSMIGVHSMPIEWRGLNNEELSEVIGAGFDLGECFCHQNGFIAGFKDLYTVLKVLETIQYHTVDSNNMIKH